MQERLKQINHYINNYESNKNSTLLNYYSIFELTESNDINLIMESIKNKKLKILFHPDLLAYIKEQNKSKKSSNRLLPPPDVLIWIRHIISAGSIVISPVC